MIKFGLFSVNSDLFRTSLAQKVRIRTFSANADHSGSTGYLQALVLAGAEKEQGFVSNIIQILIFHFSD